MQFRPWCSEVAGKPRQRIAERDPSPHRCDHANEEFWQRRRNQIVIGHRADKAV
jgi:hypothetical protein